MRGDVVYDEYGAAKMADTRVMYVRRATFLCGARYRYQSGARPERNRTSYNQINVRNRTIMTPIYGISSIAMSRPEICGL